MYRKLYYLAKIQFGENIKKLVNIHVSGIEIRQQLISAWMVTSYSLAEYWLSRKDQLTIDPRLDNTYMRRTSVSEPRTPWIESLLV